MSFLDISASLASNSLTLLVGTGLSKHFTDGKAPSWLELILQCAENISEGNEELIDELFVKNDDGEVIDSKFELTVCAQILELEYEKKQKNIKEEICEIIEKSINEDSINMEKVEEFKKLLSLNPNINIITTNYDSILSDYIIDEKRRIVIEGLPIAKINGGTSIYHIHGSIKKTESIILTVNDYFNFQHKESYFSRKLYTLLQETQIVVLGYSLSDFNLNKILNEAKSTQPNTIRGNNIYYVSRNKFNDVLKRYYLSSYGVEILEECDVSDFVLGIVDNYQSAEVNIIGRADSLARMIELGKGMYVDSAIETKGLLERILLRASYIGVSWEDEKFQEFLIKVLIKKKEATYKSGAWNQYSHLAEWLITIAYYITLKGSYIEDDYLEIVNYSFSKMSKELWVGSAWQSYDVWDSQWEKMMPHNQRLLFKYIEENQFSSRTGAKYLKDKYESRI